MPSTSNHTPTTQPPTTFDGRDAAHQASKPIGHRQERRPAQAGRPAANIEAPSGAVGEAALAQLLDRDSELRHQLLRKWWRRGHRLC